MIHYYYKHLDDSSLVQHDAYKAGAWTYVEDPTPVEIDDLVARFGLSRRFVHDALDRDEIPRLESAGDYTYIFSRFAYRTSGAIETIPVLFVVNDKALFTITPRQLPALNTLIASADAAVTTTDPASLMLRLLHEIDVHYDDFINEYSKQIRHLRNRLGKRDVGPKDFVHFVVLEDDLNDFLRALEPTSAALKRLSDDKQLPSFAKHQDQVATVILNNEESIRACNANLKAIGSIRRTYTLISSYNLDYTIKILTVAALLIAIPNMFFGMYGMNVNLPFQHQPWAYVAMLAISLLAALLILVIGRRKRLF